MKVTEQDIVYTARQLRDEENEQLSIQPWNRHRRHHLPTWIVAIPAAAIIGFVFGFWTKSANQLDTPLTALVDTIYIKVHDPQPRQDTIAQVIPDVKTPVRPREFARSRESANPASSRPQTIVGRPVSDDHIRYDLLVRN